MAGHNDRLAAIEKAASSGVRPPSEKSIQLRAKSALNEMNATICHRYMGDQGGEKGHSDLYGSYKGKSFWIEVKVPGREKTLTTLQRMFLDRHHRAGCIVGVATSVNDCIKILRGTIKWEDHV